MLLRWLRRRSIRRQQFPAAWEAILERDFARWRSLNDADRSRLRDELRFFIAERYWEGCGGLAITDEMKVLVAAQACLLLLHRPQDSFSNVSSILMYPSGYFAPTGPVSIFGAPRVTHGGTMPVLGQAHDRGPVILSWRHARDGAAADDGENLVYHEFAHKLDMMNGPVDGTPPMDTREQAREWREVMSREFAALRESLLNSPQHPGLAGAPSVLRPYALTNPAEFFAVATEVFFERPDALRAERPELHRVMGRFFRTRPDSPSESAE